MGFAFFDGFNFRLLYVLRVSRGRSRVVERLLVAGDRGDFVEAGLEHRVLPLLGGSVPLSIEFVVILVAAQGQD